MDVKIEAGWKSLLNEEFRKDYFEGLVQFVKSEYREQTVYPPGKEIFNAFAYCPFQELNVVILGQDPYHGPGQAHGLCFSVNDGITFPPSLRNIFKEVNQDLDIPIPATGNLSRWAQQGVLLLNATLTVRARQAGSHQGKGWEKFTDKVVNIINQEKSNVVFMLWGAYAQRKGELIDKSRHLVLKSAHPSPFSADRGFFGNNHFSKCNDYLVAMGKRQIEW